MVLTIKSSMEFSTMPRIRLETTKRKARLNHEALETTQDHIDIERFCSPF